jgi:YggT family protein
VAIVPRIVYYALELYILLVFVWALGSWFPRWRYQAWFRIVNDLVTPYISLFSRLPLSTGTMDFTPMIAIMVLWMLQRLVLATLTVGGPR